MGKSNLPTWSRLCATSWVLVSLRRLSIGVRYQVAVQYLQKEENVEDKYGRPGGTRHSDLLAQSQWILPKVGSVRE